MNNAISVDVDPALKKKLRAIGKKNGVTVSTVVRLALEAGAPIVDQHLSALKPSIAAESHRLVAQG